MLQSGHSSRGRWSRGKGAPGTRTSIPRGPGLPRRPELSTCTMTHPLVDVYVTMALSLTGPPCSFTTARCSVAPKSAEHRIRAYPGKQGSGCMARRLAHLGMQRSSSTPHTAGLEFQNPPRVPLKVGSNQRTWRHQWRPSQGREISPPLPVLLPSFYLSSRLCPGAEL